MPSVEAIFILVLGVRPMDGAIPVAFLVSASAQDTKRAIRIYEGLNDKKGEAAGFQQGIRTGNAGNEVSLQQILLVFGQPF